MFIRDLILPDGNILEFNTGNVVTRETRTSDMPWSELSGPGLYRTEHESSQPFIGCQTGGDIVAARLMDLLVQR